MKFMHGLFKPRVHRQPSDLRAVLIFKADLQAAVFNSCDLFPRPLETGIS